MFICSFLQFTFQAAKLAAGCVTEITEQVVLGKVCSQILHNVHFIYFYYFLYHLILLTVYM